MLSKADSVKGQGVGSASNEVISLLKGGLKGFNVAVNSKTPGDITHIHSINPSFYFRFHKYKKAGKTVVSVHFLPETVETSLSLPRPMKNIFYKYMLSFYKKADYLVTVNPYFIERLRSLGMGSKPIFYIPNFVDDKNFYKSDDSQKSAFREKYGLTQDKFTVVCAGQLQTRKGIFDFIKCAQALNEFKFVWAGGFSFGKISAGHTEIEKLVKNPPPNVKFLGIVNREKMNEIYNLADVFFLPSFEELFPMTILEAMSCNTPVLTRDLPIYKDILFDFCLKAKGVDEYIAILKKLSSNSHFYDTACEKSKKGHLFYNKNHILEQWQNFYDTIIQNSKKEQSL